MERFVPQAAGEPFFRRVNLAKSYVEKGLRSICDHITFTDSSSDRVVFEGNYTVPHYRVPIRSPGHHLSAILRSFTVFVIQFNSLGSERSYLYDEQEHNKFLRICASTAMLGFYLDAPTLLAYEVPYTGDLDLSPLPWWIRKIITRVNFGENYSIQCSYARYHRIFEE